MLNFVLHFSIYTRVYTVSVYVAYWLYYVKFVCGLIAISHRPIVVRGRRRCPHRPPPSSVSMSKIRTSAFYPLHLQISSAKFIHNLPVVTRTTKARQCPYVILLPFRLWAFYNPTPAL